MVFTGTGQRIPVLLPGTFTSATYGTIVVTGSELARGDRSDLNGPFLAPPGCRPATCPPNPEEELATAG